MASKRMTLTITPVLYGWHQLSFNYRIGVADEELANLVKGKLEKEEWVVGVGKPYFNKFEDRFELNLSPHFDAPVTELIRELFSNFDISVENGMGINMSVPKTECGWYSVDGRSQTLMRSPSFNKKDKKDDY